MEVIYFIILFALFGWIAGIIISSMIKTEKNPWVYQIIGVVVGIIAGIIIIFNTATGRRLLIDTKSDLNNGLDRIVVVYTANGDEIARYEGKIDIEANDGGYVKFDFEGKRYIYYNCFIESIADID